MTTLRSCWLWCLAVALAGVSLSAQEQSSPLPRHSIPDGTTFLVRLEDKLDASRVRPGKHFKAKLIEDLVGPDETALLRGSRIKGHVSAVGNGIHPRLLLSFDEIQTEHGWVPLIATITGVPGEHGLRVPGEEGEIERQGSSRRREVASTGIGAGVGAIGGGVVGGGRGAAIGAGIGAAAGYVEALFSDRRLQLQKGTTLEVRLDRPLQVPRR
jgi:hypothetical protein